MKDTTDNILAPRNIKRDPLKGVRKNNQTQGGRLMRLTLGGHWKISNTSGTRRKTVEP